MKNEMPDYTTLTLEFSRSEEKAMLELLRHVAYEDDARLGIPQHLRDFAAGVLRTLEELE